MATQSIVSNVTQSMLTRKNTHAIKGVVWQNQPNNFAAHIPQIKALQQKTGLPVYIVGVISSVNLTNGGKVSLPPATHYFNRLHFCKVYKQLVNAGVYSINPACIYTFANATKASPIGYNLKTCPQMFNNQKSTPKQASTAIKRLQFKNKKHARGACAIVMVHWPYSLLSNGTRQEINFALKTNPNCKFYRTY